MPLASSTNLTNQSGIIVPDEWMKGTNVAFVDSPLIYSGGTNDFVMFAHTSTRVVARVSQDKGVTWSQLTLSASDPMSADDAPLDGAK